MSWRNLVIILLIPARIAGQLSLSQARLNAELIAVDDMDGQMAAAGAPSMTFNERIDPASTAGYDIDRVPRPVVALHDVGAASGFEVVRHSHRKATLLYSLRGIINCEVDEGIWIVPPQCAVWIPGDMPHAARGSGATECYCLFVSPEAAVGLPATCCTLGVSSLLRELLFKAAAFPNLYALHGPEERLIATLLDELAAAPIERLHLPMPRDPRLRRLAQMMLADPASKATLRQWAHRITMSERSLSRSLAEELGMSFGHWRRQLHVILSLQRLSQGESVQRIATQLGYESASGFVTMFRKAVGDSPAHYLQARSRSTGLGEDLRRAPGIMLPEA